MKTLNLIDHLNLSQALWLACAMLALRAGPPARAVDAVVVGDAVLLGWPATPGVACEVQVRDLLEPDASRRFRSPAKAQ